MHTRYLVFVFLLLTIPWFLEARPGPVERSELDSVRIWLEQGQTDRCLARLEDLCAHFSETSDLYGVAECHALRGDVYLSLSNYSEVSKAYAIAAPLFGRLSMGERAMYSYSVLSEIDRFRGELQTSLEYNFQSAKYAAEIEDWSKLSTRYTIIGDTYAQLGIADSATWYLKEAVRIKEEIEDWTFLPKAYESLGISYERQGMLGRAMETYLKGVEAAERSEMFKVKADILSNIAQVLIDNRDYAKAKTFSQEALQMADTLDLVYYRGFMYSVLGDAEMGLGERRKGEQSYKKALAIFDSLGHKPDQMPLLLKIGQIKLDEKHWSEAEQWITRAKAISPSLETPFEAMNLLLLEAQLNFGYSNYHESMVKYQAVYDQAVPLDNWAKQRAALLGMGRIAKARGNYAQALESLERARVAEDTLMARSQRDYAQRLAAQFRSSQQEEQIVSLEHQNEIFDLELAVANRQRWTLWLAIGLLGTIATVGLIFFWNKQRYSKVLEQKNSQIEKSLADKELLLREIHHRVKNNLQVISSLLKLQSRYVKDPTAISAIKEGRARVRSMALIHQNLYQTEHLTGVRVKDYFDRLLDELFAAYEVGQGQINVDKKIDDLNIDIDTIIPLGLILNELITNALKYAFPAGGSGELLVRLEEQPAQQALILEVKDSGPGIPDAAWIDTPTTFGFRLIQALSDKLEAKITLYNNEGTRVVLQIFDYQKAA